MNRVYGDHKLPTDMMDVQPEGVRLYKHPETGTYQDPREGTVGCPVGPTGAYGATGGVELSPDDLDNGSWGTLPEPDVTLEVPEMQKPEEKPDPIVQQVSKEDRLEAENLQVRIQNLLLRHAARVAEMHEELRIEYDRPLQALRNRVTEMQKRMTAQYGIDFSSHAIEPDTGYVLRIKPNE